MTRATLDGYNSTPQKASISNDRVLSVFVAFEKRDNLTDTSE